MTTTTTAITWNIAQLERHTADGIVFTAHYTVDANDGTYSAGAYGSIGLEAPEDNIIPFASLTPEIIIGWVQGKLGEEKVEEIEAALQAQLDQQRTPTTAAGVPWA
jgi:microcystin-dependent protein